MGEPSRNPRDEGDTRASWARGYAIGMQIVGIAMELVIPSIAGFYLDRRVGTLPLFTLLGTALGIAVGTMSFVQFFYKNLSQSSRDNRRELDRSDRR
ncbi:MAG: AtpZ/AtpI family protein [Thermogutta sp.]|nr:AtpZ/AtpI family protein [Thermogutta terrifontis]